MAEPAKHPDDPLDFIQSCVRGGQIYWTYHVSMRLSSRRLNRDAILSTVDFYEVIECYPDDKYLPSYLVLATPISDAIHILFAVDVEGHNVRVVTAYRPDPLVWDANLKKRISK